MRFWISLVDATGASWTYGPLHSGGNGPTDCLHLAGNSLTCVGVLPPLDHTHDVYISIEFNHQCLALLMFPSVQPSVLPWVLSFLESFSPLPCNGYGDTFADAIKQVITLFKRLRLGLESIHILSQVSVHGHRLKQEVTGTHPRRSVLLTPKFMLFIMMRAVRLSQFLRRVGRSRSSHRTTQGHHRLSLVQRIHHRPPWILDQPEQGV
jgi:hypothetical protein